MATDKEFRKSLHDIIIKQISRNNQPEDAYKCIDTLNKVVGNIIKSPHDETKRKLKESNKIVHSTIREVDGGFEFLIKIGFKAKVVDFQKSFILEIPRNNDTSQLTKQLENLEIARELLEDFLQKVKERIELKERARVRDKVAEESRRKIALSKIEEDRERLAAEQERLKRNRKFQKEQQQKKTEEQLQLSTTEQPSQQEDHLLSQQEEHLLSQQEEHLLSQQEEYSYRPYHSSHFRQRFKDQDDQNPSR
ncbi:6314_t:CDS:1 [Racocetra persica]|uniref:6314_t:CDS:1 n=1 Tax=Racocetra persica TaxID=160502 RepID=A0ACA9PDG3_9GLOM|nr:6314_t:CDS:1 [Racocetra persica]